MDKVGATADKDKRQPTPDRQPPTSDNQEPTTTINSDIRYTATNTDRNIRQSKLTTENRQHSTTRNPQHPSTATSDFTIINNERGQIHPTTKTNTRHPTTFDNKEATTTVDSNIRYTTCTTNKQLKQIKMSPSEMTCKGKGLNVLGWFVLAFNPISGEVCVEG
jgi:hypothetical protein